MIVAPKDQRTIGILLTVASAVALSTAGLFARLISADVWTVLFWRGLFGGLLIGLYMAWRYRTRALALVRAIGWTGLLAAVCSAAATICFINALRLAPVADVMVISATAPFVTAGLAWLWLGEREGPVTLAASAMALIGIALMVDTAMPSGHLLGNLLALAMTILFSLMMVIVRQRRDTPMLPAASLSAFLCALAVLPAADPTAVTVTDFFWLFLFGTTQFGLGLLLMTLGTRLIPATQSALIGTLDTPLAAIWVWLAFGEVPLLMTCIGGAIVMIAVAGHIIVEKPAGNVIPASPAIAVREPSASCR